MSDLNNALHWPANRSGNLVKLAGIGATFTVTLWVLLFKQLPASSAFAEELQNSGHALIFAAVAVTLVNLLRHYPSGRLADPVRRNFAIFSLCVLAGGTVELLQSKIGRQASWYDLLLDAAGAVSGLCLSYALNRKQPGQARKTWGAVGVSVLSLCFTLPTLWWYAGVKRDSAMPFISHFESRWTNLFVENNYLAQVDIVPAPTAWTENKGRVAKLSIAPSNKWPGLLIREPYPNWQGFSTLRFDVFSPAEADFYITFRVNDTPHNLKHADRFNIDLLIRPGANHFAIPLENIRKAPANRYMDMENIAKLIWYVDEPMRDYVFYLDNIYLDGAR